jgi:type III secretion system FlhB-like substrate exporter
MTQDRRTKVVGLAYPSHEELPTVIVKGCGEMAERLLRERDWLNGPPVVKDPKLAEQLWRLPVDGQIGPELFQLVAILLTHVLAIEEQLRGEAQ